MPIYEGESVRLYRGDFYSNCREETYGLSWSASKEIAEGFAASEKKRAIGETVFLEADVPAVAIVRAPRPGNEFDVEEEFVIDRRQLGKVRVLSQYSHIPIERGEPVIRHL